MHNGGCFGNICTHQQASCYCSLLGWDWGDGEEESIIMFTLGDVWPLLHTDLILWRVEFYEPICHGRGDEKADV